ncbi:hypothetical protein A1O3_05586 [Capronia epimyces CBS 606.96]|uniref:Uncharacterized protein n=1 Tax=Capronia epimyces CBS 606.96 TaxID=1182542 RepID=W9Y6S0_9EURO|nr:uncharacterized protein A1O3_05586 [Capronia epimyces CBS 606.96]EXJ84911.1 hypothetical protein A1O3_05586 [Capronia epimyces CBS 606.96]
MKVDQLAQPIQNISACAEPTAEASPLTMLDLTKFIPFVLPLLNLGLAFLQQSTSGLPSALLSIFHIFSNPIDALWSILCRQEVIRRCVLFSTSHVPDVGREFAAVLSTYDQWLQDAQPHVLRALTNRRHFLQRSSLDGTLLITEEEKLLMRRAALRLRGCRPDSFLHTRFSIASYLGSLAIVACKILRSNDGHVQQEAGHILSLVAIFSHLIFAVCINGYVGAFLYQEEAVRIIFDLCEALGALHSSPLHAFQLLPLPLLDPYLGEPVVITTTPGAFFRKYAALGGASGTLNSLRLHEPATPIDNEGRPSSALLLISICAAFLSFQGAIAIPLLTPTRKTVLEFLPFGGCFLVWLINWLLSIGISWLFSRKSLKLATYTYIITGSDVIFTVLILGCFGWSLSNWSGTVVTTPTVSTMTIITWFVVMFTLLGAMLLLVLWVDFGRENARLVYVRSLEEALADSDAISMTVTRRLSV